MALALSSATPAFSQLTETAAVEQGLANPNLQARLEAQLREAQGRLNATGRWNNPSIEYSRETLDLEQGTSEETTIWLSQRLNIAGVNGLEKKAAEHAFEARQLNIELARRDWKRRLREYFYQTLATQRRVRSLTQQQARLHNMAEMVRRRADQGDASRFDALRVDQELALIRGRQAKAESELAARQELLFALLNLDVQALEGVLLPEPENALDFEVEDFDLGTHPRLQALHAEQLSHEIQAKAAGRERWPELTLSVGRKELNEPDISADGSAVAVGVEIPLFDRGQGRGQAARSRARQVQADIALLRRELEANLSSARQAYQTSRQAALQLEPLTAGVEGSLSQLAEASYQAGELSVMALIDAWQSDLETTEHFIDTALAARLAYIQLQYIRGDK